MSKLLCGAAIRDISPSEDMFPLSGTYGTAFKYVEHHIHVRAMALNDGSNKALVIAFEQAGIPDPDEILDEISEATGIDKNNIFVFATHAHATIFPPQILKRLNKFGPNYNEEECNKILNYFKKVHALTIEAAKEALENSKPVKLKYAFGESYINVNRTQDYRYYGNDDAVLQKYCDTFPVKVREVDGVKTVTMLGINPTGPSDKTLTLMEFEGEDGKPVAWFINHSTHSVVMHTNKLSAIDSDFSGCTSALMEEKFPGSVALWTAGSAGDQNPYIMSGNYSPDPSCGLAIDPFRNNGDPLDLEERVAFYHFDDIMYTSRFLKESEDVTIKSAKKLCKPEAKDPENPCVIGMSLLQIGPVNILGVSGELFTSIGKHLKEESGSKNTVIVSYHSATGEEGPGYILDDDGLERGAWGWNRYPAKIGATQPAMTETMKELFKEAK